MIIASVPSSILILKARIARFLQSELSQLAHTKRHRFLKQIDPQNFTLKEIWPKLDIVVCWQTSICQASIGAVKELVGEAEVLNQVYVATEGFFTIYIDNDTPVLYPLDFIYEFLELGGQETILKPWQLEPGKEYEILITSPMGFVRYRIGDIIKCTGFYKKLPLIEFVRKTKHQISLGWVTIDETEVVKVLEEMGITDFDQVSVGVDESGQGLVIDIHEKYAEQIQPFDHKLAAINDDFAREIADGRIVPSRILVQKTALPKALKPKHAQTKDQVLVFPDFGGQNPN